MAGLMTRSRDVRDPGALVRWLEKMARMPFTDAGGENDCAAFAAGAIEVQTGRKLRLPGRGSPIKAARALKRLGGMEAAVSAQLGPPISPALAQRGDIAAVHASGQDDRFGDLLLMVVEGQWLVGPGNTRAPRKAMVRAWRAHPQSRVEP